MVFSTEFIEISGQGYNPEAMTHKSDPYFCKLIIHSFY